MLKKKTNSSSSSEKEKHGRGQKTTHYQYIAILEWLEMEPGNNFKLITGDAQSGLTMVTAGAKLTKKYGYESLADYVNQKCGTSWTYENAEARYKAYLKLYKEVNRAFRNPGEEKYCLGQSDYSKGITTIDQKLEKDCPSFNRMDRLFGSKQNVIPSYVMQSGLTRPAPPAALPMRTTSAEPTSESEDDLDYDGLQGQGSQDYYATELFIEGTPPEAAAAAAAAAVVMPAVVTVAPAVAGKKRGPTPSVSAEIRALCEDSVATALTNDPADKVSYKKGRKDFTSVYAESRMGELDLATQKFHWEKQNYGKEQETKEKSFESDLGLREKAILEETKRAQIAMEAETKRTQIIQAEETKRAVLLQGMKQGLSLDEIDVILKRLA